MDERAVSYGTVTPDTARVTSLGMSPRMADDRSALVALLPHRAAVPLRRRGRRVRTGRVGAGALPGDRRRALPRRTLSRAIRCFPGVLQLEALAQAGAIAVLADARYAGQAPAVRRGRRRAVPAGRAARRRARARGRDRAPQRARRMGTRASRRSTAPSAVAPACSSRWPDRSTRVGDGSALAARAVAARGRAAAARRARSRVYWRGCSARGGGGIVGCSGSWPSRSFVSTSRGSGGSARTRRDGAIRIINNAAADAPTTMPTTNSTTLRMVPNGMMDPVRFTRLVGNDRARVVEWQTRRTQNPLLARA